MAAGNGVDLGTVVSMLSNLTQQVNGLMAQVKDLTMRMSRVEVNLDGFRQETKAEFGELRQTIDLYHGSVVGHGIAITELQARVDRVEDKVGLPHSRQ